MPVCDGCGRNVDEAHIRRRIERLEMATRFRPVHIGALLIDAAPPTNAQDFFYAVGRDGARSAAGDTYFNALAKLTGTRIGSADASAEPVLTEFQRRGFFLTSAAECPVDDTRDLSAAVRRLAPTVLRRVQVSYKPKHVVLISEATSELIDAFRTGGWADRLILDGAAPFAAESIGDRVSAALQSLG